MNIKELKVKIEALPDDMLVYVVDNEYGPEEADFAEVEEVREQKVLVIGLFLS